MAEDATPVARNSRCPCGSGRRYKDCCGRTDVAAVPRISVATREVMQRALALQMDARFSEAKVLFEQVLADSPGNGDALNMLALVEYSLGDLDRAASLAADAARMAPGLASAQENQRIIAAARRVRAFRPRVFDSASDRYSAGPGDRPLVHLYKIAGNPAGGTEWRCMDLARRLRDDANVVLWTDSRSLDAVFTTDHPVRVVDPSRGDVPHGGTLVVVGSYHRVGNWYAAARFRRVVMLYNVVDPIGAAAILEALCLPEKPKVELLFASEWLRRLAGLPGHFEPSPIDTATFSPTPRPAASPATRTSERSAADHGGGDVARRGQAESGRFVVGRLSRDDRVKFHAGAADFYRALARDGVRVRLMGALPLVPSLEGASGIEIIPQGAIRAPDFLRGLHCFTYRTHPSWTEAWGRVVTEAMATGLPVVVHANGGYAQLIRHGDNGFLFHRDDEAAAHIRNLESSPGLRLSMGTAARETIVELLSDEAFRRYRDFYLR